MTEIKFTKVEYPSTPTEGGLEDNPQIPAAIFQGIFGQYRDLFKDCTEASDNFHYVTCAQVLGNTLGRAVFVQNGISTIYPNLYTCLVGRTGLSRKDTSSGAGKKLLLKLHSYMDELPEGETPPFLILYGVGSAEGLCESFAGENKVRVLVDNEIGTFLGKAKMNGLATLIPTVTALYDCPDMINPPTRQNKYEAKNPFLSCMFQSTEAWLFKGLDEGIIQGGFANRVMFICGEPKEPNPIPQRLDKQAQDELIHRINAIRAWTQQLPDGGEISISEEAKALYAQWYVREYYPLVNNPGIIPLICTRFNDFVWKFSLLYAAIDQNPTIAASHVSCAIQYVRFLKSSVSHIFLNFGKSENLDKDDKLLAYLRKAGQPVPYTTIYRNFGWSAGDTEKIVAPMKRAGMVTDLFLDHQDNLGRKRPIKCLKPL